MWCHSACGRPAGKWRVWAGHPWGPKAVEDSGMTCCWPDLQWYPTHHPPWVHRAPFQLQSSARCCLRWASMARLSAHKSVPARDPQDAPSSCIEGTLAATHAWLKRPAMMTTKQRKARLQMTAVTQRWLLIWQMMRLRRDEAELMWMNLD